MFDLFVVIYKLKRYLIILFVIKFNNLISHVIIFFLILKCSGAIFTFSATSNHPKKELQLSHLLITIKSKITIELNGDVLAFFIYGIQI